MHSNFFDWLQWGPRMSWHGSLEAATLLQTRGLQPSSGQNKYFISWHDIYWARIISHSPAKRTCHMHFSTYQAFKRREGIVSRKKLVGDLGLDNHLLKKDHFPYWSVRRLCFKKCCIKTTYRMLKTFYHSIKITYNKKEKCIHYRLLSHSTN